LLSISSIVLIKVKRTPIEGIHGNWPGKLPSVHRWAYDYGKDGIEFIPQYVPINENESEVH